MTIFIKLKIQGTFVVLTFYDSTNLLPWGAKHSCKYKREKKGQDFLFHRNPLMLTPIYHVLVSPLLQNVIFAKVQTSTFPALCVSQADWVSLSFSQAEITAWKPIHTVARMQRGIIESCTDTEVPEKAEVWLIKHFPKGNVTHSF